jgi:hypothetical protein
MKPKLLPRYRCHKEVQAAKITRVDIDRESGDALLTCESVSDPFWVAPSYVQKHKPARGGYFVRYSDGYESFSPAEAFEGGYTLIDEA